MYYTHIDTPLPSLPMPTVIARVDDFTKAALKAVAQARGCTESDLLLAAVREIIAGVVQPPVLSEPARPMAVEPVALSREPSETVMKRVYVRLPAFLYSAARRQAAAKKLKGVGAWVGALVQSNMLRSPVMTVGQLMELKRTNRELAAIGRNLNQIARNLNLAPSEFGRVRLEILADLDQKLTKNRLAIRRLVQDAQRSWSVSDELD